MQRTELSRFGRASSRLAFALVTLLTCLVMSMATSAVADARPRLEGDETERLSRGETVIYDQDLNLGGHRYVGGTTYTVIGASMPELEGLFVDMSAYRQLLPRTKEAQLIGVNDGDFFVELRQGTSLIETSYTIRVRREGLPPRGQGVSTGASPAASLSGDASRDDRGGTVYRFWLDRAKPHGIEDAWGYFRLEPLADGPNGAPRVLLTYGILVDVGPGLVRDLFEEPLRRLALTVPQRLRRYALSHFGSGARA